MTEYSEYAAVIYIPLQNSSWGSTGGLEARHIFGDSKALSRKWTSLDAFFVKAVKGQK